MLLRSLLALMLAGPVMATGTWIFIGEDKLDFIGPDYQPVVAASSWGPRLDYMAGKADFYLDTGSVKRVDRETLEFAFRLDKDLLGEAKLDLTRQGYRFRPHGVDAWSAELKPAPASAMATMMETAQMVAGVKPPGG